MMKKITSFFQRLFPMTQGWRGAAVGLMMISLIIGVISAIDLINNQVLFANASIYFFTGIVILLLFGAALVLCLLIFQRIPGMYKWAFVCFLGVIYFFFFPQISLTGLAFIGLWVVIGCSLIGAAIWPMIVGVIKGTGIAHPKQTMALFIFGTALMALFAAWLFIDRSYQPLAWKHRSRFITPISLPDPALKGSFLVKTATYGSGKDLHRKEYGEQATLITPEVDGSPFIRDWEGIGGWFRSRYWGFGETNLPLNGRVWYPEGKGPFPLVVFVHGNHEMTASSEKGYAYLGELLASRGWIAVSIDENFLNGAWHSNLNEAPGRGWLILEHLRQWREWNISLGNLFYEKVDMERIALVGHSRGGEAVASAAALNRLQNYPGNGMIHFDYGFGIRALAALAPVDGQFLPGGRKIELEDLDYLVIHGSHDGDVRNFEGSGQFHRLHFSGNAYHFKAALYVLGANHGQFNTVWGRRDLPQPISYFLDLGQIMPSDQQQEIAKVYLSAFLEASINREYGYLPLFQNYYAGKAWLPDTLYFNEFVDSTFQYIDSSDKMDIDLVKTSLAGGTQEGKNLKIWRQGQVQLKEGQHVHLGTFIGWQASETDPPAFIIHLPDKGLTLTSRSILTFDLANGSDTESHAEKENEQLDDDVETSISTTLDFIDFSIEVIDRQGESATLSLSDYAALLPPLQPEVMKADFLDPLSDDEEYLFQTFEFPLIKFQERNPSLDITNLKTIRFIFNKTPEGMIVLDSIAFRAKI